MGADSQPAHTTPPWTYPLLALITLAGVLPHRFVLGLWPTSRDAVLWISKSDLGAPGFVRWVFFTRHFQVGYRPVTALSYTVNALMGGEAMPFRLTDLALHGLTIGLTFAVFRRVAPKLPAWGGLVAAAVVAWHPITELVVPHLARRGYPLAASLSLAGLWWSWPGAGLSRRRQLVGALLLGLGALANEGAYVAFPVLGLLWLHEGWARPDRWARLREGLWIPGAVLAVWLTHRLLIIGGVGGYQAPDHWSRAPGIALATWQALIPVGESPLALAGVVGVGLVAVLGGWARTGAASARLAAVFGAWLVGLTLVYLPQGVWFPRQVYMMLPALGLLCGVLLAQGAQGGLALATLRGAPAAVILLASLARSPALHGVDPSKQEAWAQIDAVMRDLDGRLEALPPRSVVRLVIPHIRRGGAANAFKARSREEKTAPLGSRVVVTWLNTRHRRRMLETSVLIYTPAGAAMPVAVLRREGEDWRIEVDAQRTLQAEGVAVEELPGGGAWVPVDRSPDERGRTAYLYFYDGIQGELLPL